MDLYEQLVEMQLTIFEHLAVIPQFPVLFSNDEPWRFVPSQKKKITWSAYPDFLALDIQKGIAYVVEVSKSRQSFKADDMAKRMNENRTKIETYVKWFTRESDAKSDFKPDFDVHYRFFVRSTHETKLRQALRQRMHESLWHVDALENVFDNIKNVMP